MSLISRSALLLSLALGAQAYAVDASSPRWPEGMRWEPQAVRAPVALSDLRAAAPFVVGNPPEPLGKATVASGQGAAVFLSALQTLRVTGPTEGLRFVRIPRALRPTDPVVEVEEPGIPVSPGVWYLAEPAGAGSVWFITSEKSASIEVSRPAPVASGDRGLEREALLAWVNGDGPKAPTPLDARVRTELELEAELTASLLAAEPQGSPLREAARAYRTASALRRWAEVEPIDPKTSRTRPLALPGRAARLPDSPLAYTRFDAPEGELSVTLEGPGVLELQARALVGGAPTRLLSVDGAEPVQLELDARRPAPLTEHAAALPSEGEGRKLETGEPVGALSANRILLAPGKRTYRLRWSGGALVLRGWSAQRRPTTAELLTGRTDWTDYANRAWAKLSDDKTAAAELLRRALAELDPTKRALLFTARNLEGLPPELRARLLVLRAETAPSKETISAAAEATALQGSRLSTLGWSTQLRLARLALDHGAPAIAASLLAAPEFPENGLQIAEAAALVERLPGAEALRSRTLAALELAYRREPLSPEIRSQYLRTWFRESRWSTSLPLPTAGAPAPRAQAWLDVQPDADETLRGEGALSPLRPGAQVGSHRARPRVRPERAPRVPLQPAAERKGRHARGRHLPVPAAHGRGARSRGDRAPAGRAHRSPRGRRRHDRLLRADDGRGPGRGLGARLRAHALAADRLGQPGPPPDRVAPARHARPGAAPRRGRALPAGRDLDAHRRRRRAPPRAPALRGEPDQPAARRRLDRSSRARRVLAHPPRAHPRGLVRAGEGGRRRAVRLDGGPRRRRLVGAARRRGLLRCARRIRSRPRSACSSSPARSPRPRTGGRCSSIAPSCSSRSRSRGSPAPISPPCSRRRRCSTRALASGSSG